jgi:hypothetical protein
VDNFFRLRCDLAGMGLCPKIQKKVTINIFFQYVKD